LSFCSKIIYWCGNVVFLIGRYKLLPLFHNRIRFLIAIQAELLVAYSKRIDSAVDSFGNLSYSIVRAVPNVATTDITGVEGLKRLCRWLNSAGFISRTIKEWGEDSVNNLDPEYYYCFCYFINYLFQII
jgi:hypothetical protein